MEHLCPGRKPHKHEMIWMLFSGICRFFSQTENFWKISRMNIKSPEEGIFTGRMEFHHSSRPTDMDPVPGFSCQLSLSDVYSSISDNEHVCVTSFIAEWNYCICSEVIWVSQQQRLWNIGGCNLIRTTISSQLVVDPQWCSLTNQKQIWFLPGEDDLFALMRTSYWIQEVIIRQMKRVSFPCLSLRICEFDAEAKANKQLLLCSAYTGLLTVIHGSPTPNVHIWRRMTGFENSFFHPSKSSLHTT